MLDLSSSLITSSTCTAARLTVVKYAGVVLSGIPKPESLLHTLQTEAPLPPSRTHYVSK